MAEQHRDAQPDRRPSGNQWPASAQGKTPRGSGPGRSGGKTPSDGTRTSVGMRPPGWMPPPDGPWGTPGMMCKMPGMGWMPPGMGGMPPWMGWQTPGAGWETPGTGWQTPGSGGKGWQTPGSNGQPPGTGGQTPGTDGKTPGTGWQTPGSSGKTPGTGWQTPGMGGKMPGMGWPTPGMGGKMPVPQMWAPAMRHLETACPLMAVMMSLVTEALADEAVQNLPAMRTFSEAFGAYVQATMAAAGTLRRVMQGEMSPELLGYLQDQMAALQPAAEELMTDWQELARNQTARRSSAVRAMARIMEMIWQHYQQLMTAIQPLMMWGRAMQ